MENKVSLKEALESTGMFKYAIAKEFSIHKQSYKRFVEKKSITKPQALMVEKLTGLKIEQVDVTVI